MATDKFGITKLYPTITSGRVWESKWDNGISRSWTDQEETNDIYDPEFITAHKGVGAWLADGLGNLKISGSGPRMYIMDANQLKYWHNVEITVYAMRVLDSATTWAGVNAIARTNHYVDSNLCDTRGVSARMRYDGKIDFEKITSHPSSIVVKSIPNPGGFQYNTWIGYKFVVYDLSNTNVKLELWRDDTNGLTGGTWIKINEFIDDGTNFGIAGVSCNPGLGVLPTQKLTASESRLGSETNKPNAAIVFRADVVGAEGLWYKKGSVREIVATACSNTVAFTLV